MEIKSHQKKLNEYERYRQHYIVTVFINSKEVIGSRDTCSDISLVGKCLIDQATKQHGLVEIRCAYGSVQKIPTVEVDIMVPSFGMHTAVKLEVGIMDNMAGYVLIGNSLFILYPELRDFTRSKESCNRKDVSETTAVLNGDGGGAASVCIATRTQDYGPSDIDQSLAVAERMETPDVNDQTGENIEEQNVTVQAGEEDDRCNYDHCNNDTAEDDSTEEIDADVTQSQSEMNLINDDKIAALQTGVGGTYVEISRDSTDFKSRQVSDVSLVELWKRARGGDPCYMIDHRGLLMRKQKVREGGIETDENQLIIPLQDREQVLRTAHDGSSGTHRGVNSPRKRIKKDLFWPRMILART